MVDTDTRRRTKLAIVIGAQLGSNLAADAYTEAEAHGIADHPAMIRSKLTGQALRDDSHPAITEFRNLSPDHRDDTYDELVAYCATVARDATEIGDVIIDTLAGEACRLCALHVSELSIELVASGATMKPWSS